MLERNLKKNFLKDLDKDKFTPFQTENSNALILPGWPDVTLVCRYDNRLVGLEFKVGKNKQRVNQKWMEGIFYDNNLLYSVVNEQNYSDVLNYLNNEF